MTTPAAGIEEAVVNEEMIAAGSAAIDDYYNGTKDAPFEGSVAACYRAMRQLDPALPSSARAAEEMREALTKAVSEYISLKVFVRSAVNSLRANKVSGLTIAEMLDAAINLPSPSDGKEGEHEVIEWEKQTPDGKKVGSVRATIPAPSNEKLLREALEDLVSDCEEYVRINNLHNADGSPASNHAMRRAREALTLARSVLDEKTAKPKEK